MNDVKSIGSGLGKKPYKRWSKSSEANGTSKRMEVEEIENGFIINLSEYGRTKDDKYFDNSRKFYSKENPLENDDMVLDSGLDDAITNFVNGI